MKKKLLRFVFCIILTINLIILTGCPQEPSSDYRAMFENIINDEYGVEFETESLPTVDITYLSLNGDKITATFQLDGYDVDKKIGYKLVTIENKSKWEKDRNNGSLEAPDLSDTELIQEAAFNYEYPILFMCIYDFNNSNYEQIKDNQITLINEYRNLMKKPIMERWIGDLLISGEVIKEGFEKYCKKNNNLNYSHENLPLVEIKYDTNKKAIFELDGYDEKRLVGYKFVTKADEDRWNLQRAEGNNDAPDIKDSELIKKAALSYDFPVFFIHIPEYWKTSIPYVYSRIQDVFYNDYLVKGWLENHK